MKSIISASGFLKTLIRSYCDNGQRSPAANIILDMLNNSKVNEHKVAVHRREVQARRKPASHENYHATKAALQVLGSGASGAPKCLFVFTDNHRYMFNCGEGTQRLAHEKKMKIARLEHIFFTSSTWSSIGGLPGTALTLQDTGLSCITLHGPPGLDELFMAMRKFITLDDLKVDAVKCETGNAFEDNNLTIQYIELKKSLPEDETLKDINYEADDTDYYGHNVSGKRVLAEKSMQQLLAAPKRMDFSCISYVCRIKSIPGKLNLQLCVDHGVPPGPMLGLLKNGQDVTLPDGKIIYAKDVREPDTKEVLFIVLEIPDVHYLDTLMACDSFDQFFNSPSRDSANIPSLIVHFTPNDVMKDARYQEFMNNFCSSTAHLVLNEANDCVGMVEPHKVQNKLHLLHERIFPPMGEFAAEINPNDELKNTIRAKTYTVFNLRPNLGIDHSKEFILNTEEFIAEAMNSPGFPEALELLKSSIESETLKYKSEEYPEVVFFGTGSCIPNKTRNTSAIMIHTNENSCFLMDCGEGTYGQMVRHYGKHKIDEVMRKLKGVYVSHLHADHHLGFLGVLQGRRKAFENVPYEPLILFAPNQIMSWLSLYEKGFERIINSFTFIPNNSLMEGAETFKPLSDEILNNFGLISINACFVRHCPNSYGLSVVTEQKKKITYSGDTMPADTLVHLGHNSDLLIHEATMEDDLLGEARRKMHSTIGQAIRIGERMNAQFTILTHFSQRYARIPRLSPEFESKASNVGIAFDNMRIRISDLRLLPKFYPCLKLVFADHCEDLEVKARKRAAKRERNKSLPGNEEQSDSSPKEPKVDSQSPKNSIDNAEIVEGIRGARIENQR